LDLIFWIIAGSAVLVVVSFFALRWLALSSATRVAAAAERRVAGILERGARIRLEAPRSGSVAGGIDPLRRQRYLAQIDRVAWLMDRAVPLPIVRGFGLDAVLGLLPGVGDLIGLAVGAFILMRAVQLGASRQVLMRLIAIQCTDALLGLIPVAGDLFDVVYKADVRSAELIREALESSVQPPSSARRRT
jgi:hypothetical protein